MPALSLNSDGRLESYPGCPTLSWFIAQRISDPMIELDCVILVRGKKGTGKSTGSVGLAAAVAWELQKLGKGHWSQYFTVEKNIKSVDPSGTMDMFSNDTIKKKNSILIADDVSISADARSAMTTQNKQISQIITVSRIYQNLVIMNSVYSTHIDKRLRGFADIIIDMIGVHKKSKCAVGKVYWYDVNQHTGKEYISFFRWKRKRIKYFLFPLPPPHIIEPYRKMRWEKTNEFLSSIDDTRQAKLMPQGSKREKKDQEYENEYGETVRDMKRAGLSIRRICVETGLADSRIYKLLGKKAGLK